MRHGDKLDKHAPFEPASGDGEVAIRQNLDPATGHIHNTMRLLCICSPAPSPSLIITAASIKDQNVCLQPFPHQWRTVSVVAENLW